MASRNVALDGDLDLRAVQTWTAIAPWPWAATLGARAGRRGEHVQRRERPGRSWKWDVWGELRDVAFSSPLEGCAVGGDYGPDGDWLTGVVLRTQDGGANWARVAVCPEALEAVAFVDALHGWAAGARGTLLRTIDGGTSWQPVLPVTATGAYALASGGPDRLWLAGGGGTILFSAEGAWVDPAPAPVRRGCRGRAASCSVDLTD